MNEPADPNTTSALDIEEALPIIEFLLCVASLLLVEEADAFIKDDDFFAYGF